jgi:hypothetical protein
LGPRGGDRRDCARVLGKPASDDRIGLTNFWNRGGGYGKDDGVRRWWGHGNVMHVTTLMGKAVCAGLLVWRASVRRCLTARARTASEQGTVRIFPGRVVLLCFAKQRRRGRDDKRGPVGSDAREGRGVLAGSKERNGSLWGWADSVRYWAASASWASRCG